MADSKVMQSGRYKAYPAYKDSGVEWIGEIPSGWELTRIKYVSKCLDGARIPLNASERGEMSGNVPYWGANKVVDHINDYLFNEELVLLGEDGAPFFDKNKDVAFNVSGKIWPNNHVHVLRPLMEKVEPRFLKHSLNCADFYLYISGSTRDKLNQSDMNEIFIRAPKLIEQKQIANFLDYETAKIDTLIEKQQRLIELLTEKRQAVISHAVTKGLNPDVPMKDSGVEWLGEVPGHWDVTKIGWVLEYLSYGFTNPMPTSDEGPYMLTATDISFNEILFDQARTTTTNAYDNFITDKSRPKLGDLLLTKDGTLGRVAVFNSTNKTCISQSIALLRPNRKYVLPYFMAAALASSRYQEKMIFDAGGTTIKHIYISILAKMNLALPDVNEQQEIVSYIDSKCLKLDGLISKAEQAIQLMQERRTALISAAVTGKIDVRDWVKPE